MEINTFLSVGLHMKYWVMVPRIGLQCQNTYCVLRTNKAYGRETEGAQDNNKKKNI